MAITQNHSNHILVTQPPYIDEILTSNDMLECSDCTTPMSTDQTFNDKLYLKHVGVINYSAGQTRPDFYRALLKTLLPETIRHATY